MRYNSRVTSDALGSVAVSELLFTLAVLFAAFAVRRISIHQQSAWTRGVLFDERARVVVRARTKRGRRLAARISDGLFFTMMLWPSLGESVIALRSFGLFVVDLQAFTAQAVAMFGLQRFVARARPYHLPLDDEEGEHAPGHPERWRSFFSGHTAASFTGASLVTHHHLTLSITGIPLLDAVLPPLAFGIAATVGLLRMVADRHWLSDVLAGAVLGVICGWFVPLALHAAW